MKYRFNKKQPLIPVLKPQLHCLYHVDWGFSHGVVGRCIEIDEINKIVRLRSPKTKIDFANPVKWSDLRHTRTNQVKNPH